MATKAPRKNKKSTNFHRGPLSKLEKRQIEELLLTTEDHEIARAIRRPLVQVQNYKKLYLSNAPIANVRRSEAEDLRRELHCHSSWQSIQKQFSGEELLFFENDYVEYRTQFKDMTPTELKQLQQLITLDVFMQRHNIDRIQNQEEVDRLSKLLKKEYAKPENLVDQQMILTMETQIQASRAASVSRTREYKDLLEKHQGILKDLKGTREQRIKNLDQEGKFINILKELEIAERRKGVSEISGLMDLAVERERARLAAPFQYADNIVDQPILNYETLQPEEENEYTKATFSEEDLL